MSSQAFGSRSDVRGGVLWMALGALIAIESLRMDRFESMGATLYTFPGFVPGILGAVIVLLGLMLAARGWRAARETTAQEASGEPVVTARVVIAATCCLVFALALLTRVHFALAAALFVGVFTFLFMDPARSRQGRLAVAAANGILTAAAVFYVFQEIFLVRLP